MICPQCKEDKARRTPRKGTGDAIANWFRLKPWVCTGCKARFRMHSQGISPLVEAERRVSELTRGKKWKTFRRNWLGFLIAGGLLAIMLVAGLSYSSGGQ